MSQKIKLYCMAKQDRSDRVRWLLEELNIAYDNIFLNRQNGELNTASYRQLNPMGRVPTLVDESGIIYESGAICTYLADKYVEKGLAPKITSPERAMYLQWMFFSVASLESVVAKMFTFDGKSEDQIAEIKSHVQQQCSILKLSLNSVLEKQDYLLSSGFSAADIMMASVIPGAAEYLTKDSPGIERYMARVMERPAAIRAEVFK